MICIPEGWAKRRANSGLCHDSWAFFGVFLGHCSSLIEPCRARPIGCEAAEQGLGVALAMIPLIVSREGFGQRLVAPFDLPGRHTQTLYLVSRTEQAKDKRVRAFRRWMAEAVQKAVTPRSGVRGAAARRA